MSPGISSPSCTRSSPRESDEPTRRGRPDRPLLRDDPGCVAPRENSHPALMLPHSIGSEGAAEPTADNSPRAERPRPQSCRDDRCPAFQHCTRSCKLGGDLCNRRHASHMAEKIRASSASRGGLEPDRPAQAELVRLAVSLRAGAPRQRRARSSRTSSRQRSRHCARSEARAARCFARLTLRGGNT